MRWHEIWQWFKCHPWVSCLLRFLNLQVNSTERGDIYRLGSNVWLNDSLDNHCYRLVTVIFKSGGWNAGSSSSRSVFFTQSTLMSNDCSPTMLTSDTADVQRLQSNDCSPTMLTSVQRLQSNDCSPTMLTSDDLTPVQRLQSNDCSPTIMLTSDDLTSDDLTSDDWRPTITSVALAAWACAFCRGFPALFGTHSAR